MAGERWLHPQARDMLHRLATSGEPPFETMTAEQARAIADARVLRTSNTTVEVAAVEDRTIPGPAGRLGLRIYRPRTGFGRAPLPILIYIHGGGFVVGNIATADPICRELTNRVGCIVASVEYRLAPEHRFPAAIDDCDAAVTWIAGHAAELGGDPVRLGVAGESAGGTAAAVVSLLGRDSGRFRPLLQAMVYPTLDMAGHYPSHDALRDGYFLTMRKMQWFNDHYVASPRDAEDPRASPVRARSHTDLPPALIISAELDPLVDEAAAYAGKLQEAGVAVEYRCLLGWPHGFMYWAQTEAYRQALEQLAVGFRRAFGT